MKLYINAGDDDSYIMVGCEDKRLHEYEYANFDGHNYYWVNIDTDDLFRQLVELAEWVENECREEFILMI